VNDAIEDLARAYLDARERKDAAEEASAVAAKEARAAELALSSAMDAKGFESFRLDGKTLYLFPQVHLSLTEANTAAVREALLRDAGNDAEFIQVGLNRQRVQAFYSDRWKKGETVPETLAFFVETRVRMRA